MIPAEECNSRMGLFKMEWTNPDIARRCLEMEQAKVLKEKECEIAQVSGAKRKVEKTPLCNDENTAEKSQGRHLTRAYKPHCS